MPAPFCTGRKERSRALATTPMFISRQDQGRADRDQCVLASSIRLTRLPKRRGFVGEASFVELDPDSQNSGCIMKPDERLAELVENSARFDDEAWKAWAQCLSPTERLAYIRKHRSHFRFTDYDEVIAVVRGRRFTGCSSQLLRWRDRIRARTLQSALLFLVAVWLGIIWLAVRLIR